MCFFFCVVLFCCVLRRVVRVTLCCDALSCGGLSWLVLSLPVYVVLWYVWLSCLGLCCYVLFCVALAWYILSALVCGVLLIFVDLRCAGVVLCCRVMF